MSAERGTGKITTIRSQDSTQKSRESVLSVARKCIRTLKEKGASVTNRAVSGSQRRMNRDIKSLYANGVVRSLCGIDGKDAVVVNTPTFSLCKRTRRRIEKVYNFEVPTTNNYIVESGMIVHNCDTITMLGEMETWRPSQEAPKDEEEGGLGGGSFGRYFNVDGDGDDDGGSSYFV